MTAGRGITPFRLAALMLGFGFLYLPIAVLVAYSFNASRLVTVWAGFSIRWYQALIEDDKFGAAALTSFEIGTMAASMPSSWAPAPASR
jgi:putrescine transport system permease protein